MKLEQRTTDALLNLLEKNSGNLQELWCVKIRGKITPVNCLTYFKTKGAAKTAITNKLNDIIFGQNSIYRKIEDSKNNIREFKNYQTLRESGIKMKDYTDSKVPKDVTKALFESGLITIEQFLKCD